MMKSYVDTCFLMNEDGRRYLLNTGMYCSVIATVKGELDKLTEPESFHKEARNALDFLQLHADQFEFLPPLPEEADIRKSLSPERTILADSVFRCIAIRCADERIPVRFLTADMALAEALGVYAEKITFLDRAGKLVLDWRNHRKACVQTAQTELADLLAESTVVLTASGLQSPYLHQFLRNVQAVAPEKTHRPRLHALSLESFIAYGHLSWEVQNLLESGIVAHFQGYETPYRSESAMLDALYYARTSGRKVTLIVSGWHEVVHRYDSRSHAAEHEPDAVNFRVITPMGGLQPLLNVWQLRKLFPKEPEPFPKAPEPQETPAAEPELPETDSPHPEIPEKDATPEEVVKSDGPLLAQLVKYGQDEAVLAAAAKSPVHRAMAALYACRWAKPELLNRVLQDAADLPTYCFDHWFKKSNNSPRCVKSEQLLEEDVYYESLRCVVRNTCGLHGASPSVAVLYGLTKSDGTLVAQRAKALLEMLRKRGVDTGLVLELKKAKKAKKAAAPLSLIQAERKYGNKVQQMAGAMKAAEYVAAVTEMSRPQDLLHVLLLAIKAARRQDRPATVSALLKLCDSLPFECFDKWFSRAKGNEQSPRARDMMLRKSFFDLTRRIIRLSPDLSPCDAAMQTLQNLMKDEDELVRSRARQVLTLAEEKGARLSGKKQENPEAISAPTLAN